MMNKKGAAAGGVIGAVMGVILGTILIVAVAIPIVNSVISSSNLTGLTATIVGFVPVFLALAGLVLAASLILYGGR